jgi:superfamily II DNA helicase RecQ
VSPELLLNDDRFEALWGKKHFMDKLINIVLDEAHVIKEWGGTFRTDYLKIGPIRYRFPRMIPFHLGSATVSKQLEPELVKNLHLRVDSLAVMRRNTDRPNIFLVVERMKHPANSYEDLAFIIKKNLGPGDKCPPKFLVFFNSRGEAQAGAEFLRARLSPELHDKVKWFHSGMTDQFREDEIHALIIGESFGEGSTDAAGMVSLTASKVDIIVTVAYLSIGN